MDLQPRRAALSSRPAAGLVDRHPSSGNGDQADPASALHGLPPSAAGLGRGARGREPLPPGALPWLLQHLPLDWLIALPCPLCRQPLAAAERAGGVCDRCLGRLGLTPQGHHGDDPLNWWCSGLYADQLRIQLLALRRRPNPRVLPPLTGPLLAQLRRLPGRPWLVPIPSWKVRANPLPNLLAASLSQASQARTLPLLERSRPVLGQHHLNRTLRFSNQAGSFRCRRPPSPGEARRHPLLIVDDILTTGATACAARDCLEAGGWTVLGLLCLARTPLGQTVI